MGVCPLCVVCSMITLVFLQVLEPFCTLSEQENLGPEEVEVVQPTSSGIGLLNSQTALNSISLPSDSSSAAHADLSCSAVLTDTDNVPAIPFSSFSDAKSGLLPPLPKCASVLGSYPNSNRSSPSDDSNITQIFPKCAKESSDSLS